MADQKIQRSTRRSTSALLSAYGLLLLGVVLAVVFSVALPDTFPTALTVRSILNNQTTILILALALTVVIASGEFDLSIGYVVGLTHVLTIGFIIKNGMPWQLSVVLVLLIGPLIGLINGLLVHVAKIDSFIATLGSGTICYGVAIWYTGGQPLIAPLPPAFTQIAQHSILGVPQPAVVALLIAALLWVLLEYTPAGRYLYTLGFNRKAAELSGVSTRRFGIGAFVVSGFLVSVAGVLLASRLQLAQSDTGPEFLLPAFVGALLGKTTIRPGRPNARGTVLAVIVLAIGISGLEQLGGQFYVENLFNGFTLIIAVGVAGYVSRRRTGAKPAALLPAAPVVPRSHIPTSPEHFAAPIPTPTVPTVPTTNDNGVRP